MTFPAGGHAHRFFRRTFLAAGSLALIAAASAVTPGDVIVADAGSSAASAGLIDVASGTGNRTFLSGDGTGSGAAIDTPEFVVVSPSGTIYYIETLAPATLNQVIAVNPVSGVRTVLTGTPLTAPTGMAWDSTTAALLVSDAGSSPATSAIISVNVSTGDRTIVTGDGAGSGTTIDTPRFPAAGPTGTLYYVETALGSPNQVISVNPASGARTQLTSTALNAPTGMAWDAQTSLLIVSVAGTSSADSGILSVNPTGGAEVFLTGDSQSGEGVNINAPESAAVTTPGVIYYYELVDPVTANNVIQVAFSPSRTILSGSDGPVGTGTAFVALTGVGTVPAPPLPAITSAATATGTALAPFTYTITATNSPGSFSLAGTLPAGVTLNTSTGVISGTPAAAGTFNVTLSAANLGGTGTAPLAITINPALGFSPASLTPAAAGVPTAQTLSVLNGTRPLTGLTVTGFSSGGTGLTSGALTTNLSLGTVALSGTATTPGSVAFTVNATDSAGATASMAYTLMVTAGAATHFVVSAPGSATAGTPVSVTVTARDAENNTATGYTGTVHFTSTDPAAALPADGTLTSGTGSFSVTLETAGARTVTATDTVASSITGVSGTVTVAAGAATHLSVSVVGSTATAGSPVSVTVIPEDASGNTATTYAGTLNFSSSDGAAHLPANSVFVAGAVYAVTFATAGSQTVTVTDTVTSSITGTSAAVSVVAGAATHFVVSAPGSATAGTPVNVTVTARDAENNTATGYTGTVHFSSTDAASVLPANQTLTIGSGSFAVTLNTAGARTVTATDTVTSSITGVSGTITVAAGNVSHLTVTAITSTLAGVPLNVLVTAKDASNNTVSSYAGTVHITSSDGRAVLPANAGLINGNGSFPVTLETAGLQSVTATDTVVSSINGNSGDIGVIAASVYKLAVSAPASATAGIAFSATVTAEDVFGNPVIGYGGSVHFSSSDGAAILPADATLTGGNVFSVIFATAGDQTVTATDSFNPSITGMSGAIAVSAAPVPTPTPTPVPTPPPVPPPAIVIPPMSQSVNTGATAVFSVTASNAPSTYQWNFNGVPIAGATNPLLVVSNAQASNAGMYTVTITNASGGVTSSGATLTVNAAGTGTPPSFTLQPTSQTMATGSTVVFNALAGGSAPITYQWFWNDVAVAGAVNPTLVLGNPTAANDGSFMCLATNASGSALSSAAMLDVITTNTPGRPINISCRAMVGTGAEQLIIGFVVGGEGVPGPASLLIRASGPALVPFGVTGVLPDPALELNGSGGVLATNQGWGGNASIAAAAASVGAFPWTDPASLDSALLESLAAGPYTVVISGASGDTGVALAEVYDATPTDPGAAAPQRLVNISSRAQVGTGSGVLIAGFVVGGSTSKTVLIRASGPALVPFGVTGVLADPQLQLEGSGGLLATNNGWGGDPTIAATAASVGAFSWSNPSSHDSALLLTLAPGAYTAVVSGASGDTGIGLIEVYVVP